MKLITVILVAGAALAGCKSRREGAFARTAADDAGIQAKKFATEAYPLWQTSHAGKACPDSLDDLNEWADSKDGEDPWGTHLRMVCGAAAPAAAKGFGVVSAGEDKRFDTADDIKSWEQ